MDVRLPDGTVIRNVPDGTTKAQLADKLKANGMAVPAEWMGDAPQPSPVVQTGQALREVPRQVGLTARYGLEGPAQALEMFTEPIRRMVVNPLLRLAGQPGVMPLREGVSNAADAVGLPAPETPGERVVGDATRAGFGVMAGAGAYKKGAELLGQGASKAANVLEQLAARPGVQAVGAAGAGASGGAVREAGGSPAEQFGAALLGGLVTGYAGAKGADLADKGATLVRSMVTPKEQQLRAADQAITLTLQRSGIDWSAVPPGVKNQLRDEVAQALNTGQPLNEDALRRLVAFRRTGTTPTVGMLTQDPGQITREMNLAKTGANSIDPGLQRLPQIQNKNAAQLLDQIDQMGAAGAPNAMGAGRSAIESLDRTVAANQQNINRLYSTARDTQGRSLPLEGGTFTKRANQLLDEQNVGSFLPADIANKMNAIAQGKFPLTVDVAEQLKTSIGNLQRGSADGNVRRALGLVRQALDDTPLQGAPTVNPGNLPAVPGTVPPSPTIAGQESIDAFNAARSANRQWMQRVEGNPALKAVVDGVEPDQFVQKFIVGKGASASDVAKLSNELTPQAKEAMRGYLARHLRDAATNSTDDITKFSNDAYRRAMRDIGEDKLAAFFSREEIDQLKAIGDAGKYMQAQPTGSAVNNSNSGALVLGRGLDLLDKIAGYVPLGGRDILKGYIQGAQQTQVLRPQNALVQLAAPKEQPLLANPLLAASVVAPGDSGKDQRRDKRP